MGPLGQAKDDVPEPRSNGSPEEQPPSLGERKGQAPRNPIAPYVARLRERNGGLGKKAMVAGMGKLTEILWAMLTKGETYDPKPH